MRQHALLSLTLCSGHAALPRASAGGVAVLLRRSPGTGGGAGGGGVGDKGGIEDEVESEGEGNGKDKGADEG